MPTLEEILAAAAKKQQASRPQQPEAEVAPPQIQQSPPPPVIPDVIQEPEELLSEEDKQEEVLFAAKMVELEKLFPNIPSAKIHQLGMEEVMRTGIPLSEALDKLKMTLAAQQPTIVPEPIKQSPQIQMTLSPNLTNKPVPEKKVTTIQTPEDEDESAAIITVIFGHKGDGKTTLAFAYPGRKFCLSLDKKSVKIKKYLYNNDKSIAVFDGIRGYVRSTPDLWLQSASICVDNIFTELARVAKLGNDKPDWVIVDGLEVFTRMAEMKMRLEEGLRPYQGTPNPNVWKRRRELVNELHNLSCEAASLGVIYTTYMDKDEVVLDGQLVTKKDVPRWIDVVMEQTDIVIKTTSRTDQTGAKFFASVETSKFPFMKTGRVVDITNCFLPDVGLKNLMEPGTKFK